jgi:Flp pilus assembly protein CpaB
MILMDTTVDMAAVATRMAASTGGPGVVLPGERGRWRGA